MSSHTCFDVTVSDKIARLHLCRPEKLNSMIPEFWTELPAVVDEVSSGSEARVIVLSAEGRHFCAGMDLSVFTGGDSAVTAGGDSGGFASRGRANFRLAALAAQRSISSLEESRLPVLAAIQGACVGGGLDLASACDMRYATPDAFFCVQEINIGMTADVGTLQRMPKLVPAGIVRELAYTGRRLPADEAQRIGFVNRVFDDTGSMTEGVMEIAVEIAAKSPTAIWGTKQSLNYSRDHSVSDGLEYIATWNAAMLDPDDMAEAFAAQQERREPKYPDHRRASKGI